MGTFVPRSAEEAVGMPAAFQRCPVGGTRLQSPHPGLDLRMGLAPAVGVGQRLLADETHLDVRPGQLLTEQVGAASQGRGEEAEVIGQFALDARLQRRPCRRSEEHTSELQSRQYLVCRLLLEKKKYDRLMDCSRVRNAADVLEVHELLKRTPVFAEKPAQSAGDTLEVLLLKPEHLHAQVRHVD